jgi:hypothetical protein
MKEFFFQHQNVLFHIGSGAVDVPKCSSSRFLYTYVGETLFFWLLFVCVLRTKKKNEEEEEEQEEDMVY